MKKSSLFILISILFLSSCLNKPKENSSDKTLPTADNSKTSIDWNGTYKGVLPCADCEGIETFIKINKDNSYYKKVKYLGKEDKFTISKGNFNWDDNGNLIYLDTDKPNGYRVGENQLFALDMNDERITGDLQDLYVLKKLSEEDLLFETYWTLVKLHDKTIPKTKNNQQEAHIMLIKSDTLLVGSGGCNRLRASFELEANNHLSFRQISTTLMACDYLEIEDKFLKILGNVSQYEMKKDSLLLFNKDKTNLASFIDSESPE